MATRWGIVSAGLISHDFVTAMNSLPNDEHVVVAVAARNLSHAEDFAKQHNIQKAYNDYEQLAKDKDIEIVYIGAIHTEHYKLAMMMLTEGKHVLCEKPMTMNPIDTTKLITYARNKNLFLMEGVWSRCFPIYDNIKKMLEAGCMGDIHHVSASFGFDLMDVDRITKKELGGGTVLDLGIYCLQFVSMVYNNEMPERIITSGSLNEDGVDISMTASLYYKDNRSATITTSALVNLPNKGYICGAKNTVEVPTFWCPTKLIIGDTTIDKPLLELKNAKFNFINSIGLAYEAAEARACIQKGLVESPHITHDTSLLLAKLEEEILKALGVNY
ncbi:trans-1,2-dihydrobenzene-1,2-diol dehydrogenase [Harpegnathos saltator]|uniref:Trans-1,2-dihydrobenzene-1,2-diol dehydrogenase n=1 Tax=Harpegnathos saltator TaxID=610380 RepID=E2BUF6_HARSA|nr:trans-1,2-dihydrobenzene-1,2-diol dehydrogenase [Harpegnathos saltator]EFN80683.1 Trans-1,2-dihydrobenzene-1,2-diol dehydrogenase [Harpegnathos saltator]